MNPGAKKPRTLFIKQQMDVFGAWKPSKFSETTPRDLLDTFLYKSTLWEMTLALEADWAIIPVVKENVYTEYVRNLSHAREAIEKYQNALTPLKDVPFSNYDLVIALEPFLEDDVLLAHPKTAFIYLRHEHANDEYQRDLIHPIGYYHAFMDHMCGAVGASPMPAWQAQIPYMRAPDAVRACFPRTPYPQDQSARAVVREPSGERTERMAQKPRVFVEPRTIILAVKKDSQDVWIPECDAFLAELNKKYNAAITTRSVQHSRFYAVTEDGSSDAALYYGTLASNDYFLSLNAAGAGQALADAASAGAMCIGNKNLVYHRMICPALCLMDNLHEALEFVGELHKNPAAQQAVRRTQDANIKEHMVRNPIQALSDLDPLARIPKPKADSYKSLSRGGVVEMGFPRKVAT